MPPPGAAHTTESTKSDGNSNRTNKTRPEFVEDDRADRLAKPAVLFHVDILARQSNY